MYCQKTVLNILLARLRTQRGQVRGKLNQPQIVGSIAGTSVNPREGLKRLMDEERVLAGGESVMADKQEIEPSYDRPIFSGSGSGPGPKVRTRRRMGLQAKMFLFSVVVLGAIVAVATVYLRPESTRYVLDNYQVVTVGTRDFRTLFITSGRVVPDQISVFTAPGLPSNNARAEVARVHVAPGDQVVAGQVLVELLSEALLDEVRKIEADHAAAQIELEQALLQSNHDNFLRQRELEQAVTNRDEAQQNHAFLQQLYERGGISKRELDEAAKAVDQSEAQIHLAEHAMQTTRQRGELTVRKAQNVVETLDKQLAALYTQVEGLTVRATSDGSVLSLAVAEGAMVGQGTELVFVADLSLQHVQTAVTPQQAVELQPGMSALLRFGNYTSPATVAFVAPQATTTNEGSAVPVRLALDPEVARTLVPNTDLSVEIELGIRADRHAVARGPFFASGDTQFVYVVDEDGTQAHRRDVRFGSIEGSVIEVLDGVQPGERIIYSSYSAFRAYPTIELLPEGGRAVAWP